MSSVISTAFDAIYLLTSLVISAHCIHLLFRRATPLKSTTYLLLIGSLVYVAAWSVSLAGDVGYTTFITAMRGVGSDTIEPLLKMILAGGILHALGFALVSATIFHVIAAGDEGKAKTLLWIGIGSTALLAALDIASISFTQWLKISSLHHSPSQYLYSTGAIVVLGLGIPAIIFQIVFLIVLGKAGAPYKQHPSLYLIPKVIFPIIIFRVLLVVINAVILVTSYNTGARIYLVLSSFVISGIEPIIAGFILRIAYIWNPERGQMMQVESKTASVQG